MAYSYFSSEKCGKKEYWINHGDNSRDAKQCRPYVDGTSIKGKNRRYHENGLVRACQIIRLAGMKLWKLSISLENLIFISLNIPFFEAQAYIMKY